MIDLRMMVSSVAVGRVRPIDDGVLEQNLVQRSYIGIVVRVLQAQPAEFAAYRIPSSADSARGVRPRSSSALPISAAPTRLASELGVAQAEAPTRHEL
jgi:hypothetical protein